MTDFKVDDLVYHWTNKNKIWRIEFDQSLDLKCARAYGKYNRTHKTITTFNNNADPRVLNCFESCGWSLFTEPFVTKKEL